MVENKVIIPVVVAVITNSDVLRPRILLHKKNEACDEDKIPRNPELVGLWEFPGGMMKYGEPPEFALMRECKEELPGLVVNVGKLLTARTNIYKDGVHYLVLYYACSARNVSFVQEGCKWVRPEDISVMKCLSGTWDVVKRFCI